MRLARPLDCGVVRGVRDLYGKTWPLRWRAALVCGALIEILIVSALVLYGLGVLPPIVFGGVRIQSAAFALHLPGSLLSFPILRVAAALGLSVVPSFAVAAVIVGALQAFLIGALALGFARYSKVRAVALALLVVTLVAVRSNLPPYPDGMDSNHDGLASIEEWTRFHSTQPKFYGGYDSSGYIAKGSADYYEREFKRVDCNHDSKMDAYEYGELRWNLRWCESPMRPPRPWWR